MANKLTQIKSMIYEIRGHKIMFDSDLADLYEVETFNLNKAVKRNIERFPSDFMFQLTKDEWENLTFQNGISSKKHGGRRYPPYAFTEHGVLMLSNVLNSKKAVNMSIQIIRVFEKLRKYALEQTSKDARITEIHKLLMLHIENNDYKFSEYDETIRHILQALNNLIEHPPKTRRIGFTAED
jgi:phage regulator Rha-like protein